MTDERRTVVQSVERLLIDVLKLHESGCANRMAITGSTVEGMFLESAKAEHPVRVIIWKQWVLQKERTPNRVKDLSALRRVVIREIRDRFLAQCQETMNRARDQRALLEWKLIRSKSDADDSILIKSRITGIVVSIQVAGIITEVGCAKSRSFVVRLPNEKEAILNEFYAQRQLFDDVFLKGGHALTQDHQRLREVFEQNIDAILAPLQWYDIATKWFSNRDYRAVACRQAVWDRIMAGKESEECDLEESVPADELVCAIIEQQLYLNPRTRKSDLIDAVFVRLSEISSKMSQPLSWLSPPEPMVIQALVDKDDRPQHYTDCLEYIRGIESPGFVNKWKQKQLNRLRTAESRKTKGRREKYSMPERARLGDPLIVLASNGRRASLMNDFCEWLGLWQALTHDYRVPSSSAKKGKKRTRVILPLVEMDKECMARYERALDNSKLLRDKQEYNRVTPKRINVSSVSPPSPNFSFPPVHPSAVIFSPLQGIPVAPIPPPPPLTWSVPSTDLFTYDPRLIPGMGSPVMSSYASSASSSLALKETPIRPPIPPH